MHGLLLAAIIALVLALVTFVLGHNRLVLLRSRADEAWLAVEANLQRRHAVVAEVLAWARGQAGLDPTLVEALTRAHSRAATAAGRPATRLQDENCLAAALAVLLSARSPDPAAAGESPQTWHRQLAETDGRIEAAARFYTAAALDFNRVRATFPLRALAAAVQLEPVDPFEPGHEPEPPANR